LIDDRKQTTQSEAYSSVAWVSEQLAWRNSVRTLPDDYSWNMVLISKRDQNSHVVHTFQDEMIDISSQLDGLGSPAGVESCG